MTLISYLGYGEYLKICAPNPNIFYMFITIIKTQTELKVSDNKTNNEIEKKLN